MSQSDAVPTGLKNAAGVIWRILIILAGLAVIGIVFNRIFAVVFALFFAMLVTAWTQPLMKVFHKVKHQRKMKCIVLGISLFLHYMKVHNHIGNWLKNMMLWS